MSTIVRRRFRRSRPGHRSVSACIAGALSLASPGMLAAKSWVVTNCLDTGSGSLRDAAASAGDGGIDGAEPELREPAVPAVPGDDLANDGLDQYSTDQPDDRRRNSRSSGAADTTNLNKDWRSRRDTTVTPACHKKPENGVHCRREQGCVRRFIFGRKAMYRRNVGSGLVPILFTLACAIPPHAAADPANSDPLTVADATGLLRTFSSNASFDTSGAFFQSLGTNGRSCNTCHRLEDGWTISPAHLQARFAASDGTDPVFRPVDGATNPADDVSTLAARRTAYNMLLSKALIRVGLPLPTVRQFSLVDVDDPYGHASATDLSLFRRPLPATNLRFITTAMWDGRETHAPFLPPMDAGADAGDLVASLSSQAHNATMGHAQANVPPTAEQIKQIVDFELGLTTAQVYDRRAGWLNSDDALGGPRILANLAFYVGINDVLGADPSGAAFAPASMQLFDAWTPANGNAGGAARAAIARGEILFGGKTIAIRGVGGLNDALGMPLINGTCTSCHDAPGIGNHSVSLPIDIGVSDVTRRTPDLPLYTLRNDQTGELRQTTDPGRALLTGQWADIGKVKGPVLRGLAARPPYFHNGSAATLGDVVDFYDSRFNIGFTAQEKADLVAFLSAL